MGRERPSFLAGCALLVAALVTPLDTLARTYLSGRTSCRTSCWQSGRRSCSWWESRPQRSPADSPGRALCRPLTQPFVALPLWVLTYAAWHVPALYDAALRRPNWLLPFEHATYVLVGVLFWWCVWQNEPHRLSSGVRAGYVVAAFVLSAPLGLVLALVPNAIYDAYASAPERVFDLSRLEDQQLGGMTMAAEAVAACVLRRLRVLVPPLPLRAGEARGMSSVRVPRRASVYAPPERP